MNNDNPLSELYTSNGPLDIRAIANVLKRFVAIQEESHKIYFRKDGAGKLTAENKILTYGLTTKILGETKTSNKSSFSSSELEIETGLKKGTIDPTIQKLKKGGLLIGSGNYEIPSYAVDEIVTRLTSVK